MVINILLPHYGYRPTGGFKVAYIYANAFVEKGFQVNIVYPATIRKGIRGIPGVLRTYTQKKDKSDWFKINKKINRIYTLSLLEKNIPDADVTIATAYETAVYLNDYSLKKGKKIYLIQDLEIWAANKEKVLKTWKYQMSKIVISKYLLEIAEKEKVNNVFYIPNALDKSLYRVYNDLKNRENIISMMYSPAIRKGYKYGIEAIKQIKKRFPNIKVIIFGKYGRPAECPNWAEYYENPEQYFLIREIYNRAKIFICPSIYEGWGLPAMEAMACGAAVVTTDCGGVRDFAIPDITAKVCKIKDSTLLTSAAMELLENEQLRQTLVKNALNKIDDFDWNENVLQFLKVIRNNEEQNEVFRNTPNS